MQSTAIGVHDIFRINELVEHAKFHSQEYGDSLFVFISKHYGELKKGHMENNPIEQNDHEKLPFNHNSCQQHISQVFLLESLQFSIRKVDIPTYCNTNFYYQEPSSSLFTSGVFQPPKHA